MELIKTVFINVNLRDETGEVVGSDSASGHTTDDGATITVPVGYLPNITDAAPEDIHITVQSPPTPIIVTGLLGDEIDNEVGVRILSFEVLPQ